MAHGITNMLRQSISLFFLVWSSMLIIVSYSAKVNDIYVINTDIYDKITKAVHCILWSFHEFHLIEKIFSLKVFHEKKLKEYDGVPLKAGPTDLDNLKNALVSDEVDLADELCPFFEVWFHRSNIKFPDIPKDEKIQSALKKFLHSKWVFENSILSFRYLLKNLSGAEALRNLNHVMKGSNILEAREYIAKSIETIKNFKLLIDLAQQLDEASGILFYQITGEHLEFSLLELIQVTNFRMQFRKSNIYPSLIKAKDLLYEADKDILKLMTQDLSWISTVHCGKIFENRSKELARHSISFLRNAFDSAQTTCSCITSLFRLWTKLVTFEFESLPENSDVDIFAFVRAQLNEKSSASDLKTEFSKLIDVFNSRKSEISSGSECIHNINEYEILLTPILNRISKAELNFNFPDSFWTDIHCIDICQNEFEGAMKLIRMQLEFAIELFQELPVLFKYWETLCNTRKASLSSSIGDEIPESNIEQGDTEHHNFILRMFETVGKFCASNTIRSWEAAQDGYEFFKQAYSQSKPKRSTRGKKVKKPKNTKKKRVKKNSSSQQQQNTTQRNLTVKKRPTNAADNKAKSRQCSHSDDDSKPESQDSTHDEAQESSQLDAGILSSSSECVANDDVKVTIEHSACVKKDMPSQSLKTFEVFNHSSLTSSREGKNSENNALVSHHSDDDTKLESQVSAHDKAQESSQTDEDILSSQESQLNSGGKQGRIGPDSSASETNNSLRLNASVWIPPSENVEPIGGSTSSVEHCDSGSRTIGSFITFRGETLPWILETSIDKLGVRINRFVQHFGVSSDSETYARYRQVEAQLKDPINEIETLFDTKCSLVRYGSVASNVQLCIPYSDFDIAIKCEPVKDSLALLFSLMNIIASNRLGFTMDMSTALFAGSDTAPPLLKLSDLSWNSYPLRVDVTVYNPGIHTTINLFNNVHWCWRPLSLLLKYFLQMHQLNEARYGGLSSYVSELLVLYHVQNNATQCRHLGFCLLEFLKFIQEFNAETQCIEFVNGIGRCIPRNERFLGNKLCVISPIDSSINAGINARKFQAVQELLQTTNILECAMSEIVYSHNT